MSLALAGDCLLTRRLAVARQTQASASFELTRQYAEARRAIDAGRVTRSLEHQLRASGLFDPEIYLALNPDLATHRDEAWHHFFEHGLAEGRPFTNPETVARLVAEMSLTEAAYG